MVRELNFYLKRTPHEGSLTSFYFISWRKGSSHQLLNKRWVPVTLQDEVSVDKCYRGSSSPLFGALIEK